MSHAPGRHSSARRGGTPAGRRRRGPLAPCLRTSGRFGGGSSGAGPGRRRGDDAAGGDDANHDDSTFAARCAAAAASFRSYGALHAPEASYKMDRGAAPRSGPRGSHGDSGRVVSNPRMLKRSSTSSNSSSGVMVTHNGHHTGRGGHPRMLKGGGTSSNSSAARNNFNSSPRSLNASGHWVHEDEALQKGRDTPMMMSGDPGTIHNDENPLPLCKTNNNEPIWGEGHIGMLARSTSSTSRSTSLRSLRTSAGRASHEGSNQQLLSKYDDDNNPMIRRGGGQILARSTSSTSQNTSLRSSFRTSAASSGWGDGSGQRIFGSSQHDILATSQRSQNASTRSFGASATSSGWGDGSGQRILNNSNHGSDQQLAFPGGLIGQGSGRQTTLGDGSSRVENVDKRNDPIERSIISNGAMSSRQGCWVDQHQNSGAAVELPQSSSLRSSTKSSGQEGGPDKQQHVSGAAAGPSGGDNDKPSLEESKGPSLRSLRTSGSSGQGGSGRQLTSSTLRSSLGTSRSSPRSSLRTSHSGSDKHLSASTTSFGIGGSGHRIPGASESSCDINSSFVTRRSAGVLQDILFDGNDPAQAGLGIGESEHRDEENARRLIGVDNMVPFYPPERFEDDEENGQTVQNQRAPSTMRGLMMCPPKWSRISTRSGGGSDDKQSQGHPWWHRRHHKEDENLSRRRQLPAEDLEVTPSPDMPSHRNLYVGDNDCDGAKKFMRGPSMRGMKMVTSQLSRKGSSSNGGEGGIRTQSRDPWRRSHRYEEDRHHLVGQRIPVQDLEVTPTPDVPVHGNLYDGGDKKRSRRMIIFVILGVVVALILAVSASSAAAKRDGLNESVSSDVSNTGETIVEDHHRERTRHPSFRPTMNSATTPKVCVTLQETSLIAGCSEGASGCNSVMDLHGDVALVSKREDHLQLLSKSGNGSDGRYEVVYSEVSDSLGVTEVAVSENYAVVSSSPDNLPRSVHVYERNAALWRWKKSAIIIPQDILEGVEFGAAVDIDDDIIVAGAPMNGQGDRGSVYVYHRHREAGLWIQDARLTAASGNATGDFGRSLTVLGDSVAVGDESYGDGAERKGAVFVYRQNQVIDLATGKSQTSWTQLGDSIANDDCDGRFGSSVTLTNEGLLVGCPGNGALYYYERTNTGYALKQKVLVASPGDSMEEKPGGGGQVAADGNYMVAGTKSLTEGKVYVFALANGLWVKSAMIEAFLGSAYFGSRVSISGSSILVSSKEDVYSYTINDCSSSADLASENTTTHSPSLRPTMVPPIETFEQLPSLAHVTPQPANESLSIDTWLLTPSQAPLIQQVVHTPTDATPETQTAANVSPSMIPSTSDAVLFLPTQPMNVEHSLASVIPSSQPTAVSLTYSESDAKSMPSSVPSMSAPPTSIQYLSMSCRSNDNNTHVHLPELCLAFLGGEDPSTMMILNSNLHNLPGTRFR